MLRSLAPPHVLLAAYCGGLCLALAVSPPVWLLVLGAAAALACLAAAAAGALPPARRAVLVPCGLAVVFLVAGLVAGGARLQALAGSSLAARTGHTVTLRAELVDLPAIDDQQVTLAVRVTAVDGVAVREPAHLRLELGEGERLALDSSGALSEGALLALSAVRVEALPEPRPGEFDYGRYLRRRGEHVLLEGDIADLHIVGRRGGLQGLVDKLRRASREHLRAGLHGQVAEVLQGMVLGDDEGVDEQLISDFRRSGLLHIMAVSGENVVLLCGMWSFALALLGVPRLARTAMLLPIVATYVLLTGATPSIVRAGVAGIVGLLAILVSRPTDGWFVWLVPAGWLLTVNPNTLFDVSFQLSFGAVAGLLVLARPLTRALSFLPEPLPEQIGVTTAASISTAPVSMLTFGSASLVSVPANVAGGFVLGPIMFVGMLSLLLGFASPWLAVPLNVVAGLFIGFLLAVARVFGRLPGAVYEWQGLSLGLLLTLSLAALAVTVVVVAARRGEPLLAFTRRHVRTLAVAAAVLVAVSLVVAPAPAAAPKQPTLTVLSVGEGAAALLQVPGGPTVLIDAGPGPLAAKLRRHGVDDIDLLVLSHGHADHAAGLDDVLGRVTVRRALLPQPAGGSAALDELAAKLTAAGCSVQRCRSAVELRGKGWSLRVLPTTPPAGEDGNQGENDCALVVLAELGGQRVLVPGDCEGDVLAGLELPSCAAVELPHHGSRGGFDEEMLERLSPRLAVVSVGPNTYGHPTAEMLDLLKADGVPCLRTDQRGDIALWAGAGGLRVSAAD